jgi:hypothetical protein
MYISWNKYILFYFIDPVCFKGQEVRKFSGIENPLKSTIPPLGNLVS